MSKKVQLEKKYLSNVGWVEVYVFHSVYVLYKKNTPVYVGVTKDLDNRMKSHKLNKDFDSYSVVFNHSSRKEALKVERSLITAVRFINPESLNKTNVLDLRAKELTNFVKNK